MARITADVLDKDIDILAFEAIQLTIHQSQVTTIAITTYGTEGTKLGKSLSYFHRTYVTSMPYLVAGLEIVQIFRIPVGMGVT
jgi:hypothetical protein